ncbi:MAG: hypothetical protein KA170_19475 [Candidatus Promineofilum sp.]|nr:hypothetical protein [Promineifilum sp.]
MDDGATQTVTLNHRRFDRAAGLSLAFAVLILLASTAQLVYRYFLPTDGWYIVNDELSTANFLYFANLVGVPSGLASTDVVTGVEGRPLGEYPLGEAPPFWYAGNVVRYDIRRSGVPLTVDVPIVHWTPVSLFRSLTAAPSLLINFLGPLLLAAIGFLAFLKRPEDPAARALLIFVSVITAQAISAVLPDGLSTSFDPLGQLLAGFFSYMIFGVLLAPALLSFMLVFPRPKTIIVRHPWLAYTPFLIGGLILAALLITGAWQPGWVGTMLMLLAALISLGHSALTMRDSVSRAQLLWAFGGFALGIGLFLFNFPAAFGWVGDAAYGFTVVSSLGIPVMGLGLAIAVLRYRLFDIGVIIRRTTAYAILTALLALVYFGSVVVLQQFLTPLTGDSAPAVVLSTLLIAALFLPLRRRVQDLIDRRFFRQKYDVEKTLAAFAATVRNETDLDALTAELVRVIQETMQPEFASVWLCPVESREATPGSPQ